MSLHTLKRGEWVEIRTDRKDNTDSALAFADILAGAVNDLRTGSSKAEVARYLSPIVRMAEERV